MTDSVKQKGTARDVELIEFQPAALELQMRPPSPIGRAISITIAALFVVAIAWASLGDIDIVAIANGKIIPSERVKVIQPLESGKISIIHVKDGDAVVKNQILITLDTTQTHATLINIKQELANQQNIASRLVFIVCEIEQKSCSQPKISATQLSLLRQQIAEYWARQRELETQKTQTRALKKNAEALLTKQERTLPLLVERVTSFEELMKSNLGARHQYLVLQQELIEVEQDSIAQQARIEELVATELGIDNAIVTLRAETLAATLGQLQESERMISGLQQEFIKATQRDTQQVITAPIDGTVQELMVTTLGGVVTPAQELMKIVPANSLLEIQASVLNKDIGFVREGQRAAIKLDAFPFTKYGLIEGEIITISEDAKIDQDLGLVYLAKVAMAQDFIDVDGRNVNLAPGMRATVEVKTGTRKVIEFFLAPLLRYKQESIRER
jgi:hemolysin D